MAENNRSSWCVGCGSYTDSDGVDIDLVAVSVNYEKVFMSIDSAEQMAKQLLLMADWLRAQDANKVTHG